MNKHAIKQTGNPASRAEFRLKQNAVKQKPKLKQQHILRQTLVEQQTHPLDLKKYAKEW